MTILEGIQKDNEIKNGITLKDVFNNLYGVWLDENVKVDDIKKFYDFFTKNFDLTYLYKNVDYIWI